MIMDTEQLKTNSIKFVIHFWYIIIIILFMSISTYLYSSNVKKDNKIFELNNIVKINESITETESHLDAMKKRESELYPVLQKQYEDINKNIIILENQRSNIILTSKKKVQDELEKYSNDDLNRLFGTMGYSTKPFSCK